MEWFYNKVASHQQPTQGGGLIKGYEKTMEEGRKSREMGFLEFDQLAKYGACVAGDPDHCLEQLERMQEAFGITEFVLWSNLGGMPAIRAEESIRLAREAIAPRMSLKVRSVNSGNTAAAE